MLYKIKAYVKRGCYYGSDWRSYTKNCGYRVSQQGQTTNIIYQRANTLRIYKNYLKVGTNDQGQKVYIKRDDVRTLLLAAAGQKQFSQISDEDVNKFIGQVRWKGSGRGEFLMKALKLEPQEVKSQSSDTQGVNSSSDKTSNESFQDSLRKGYKVGVNHDNNTVYFTRPDCDSASQPIYGTLDECLKEIKSDEPESLKALYLAYCFSSKKTPKNFKDEIKTANSNLLGTFENIQKQLVADERQKFIGQMQVNFSAIKNPSDPTKTYILEMAELGKVAMKYLDPKVKPFEQKLEMQVVQDEDNDDDKAAKLANNFFCFLQDHIAKGNNLDQMDVQWLRTCIFDAKIITREELHKYIMLHVSEPGPKVEALLQESERCGVTNSNYKLPGTTQEEKGKAYEKILHSAQKHEEDLKKLSQVDHEFSIGSEWVVDESDARAINFTNMEKVADILNSLRTSGAFVDGKSSGGLPDEKGQPFTIVNNALVKFHTALKQLSLTLDGVKEEDKKKVIENDKKLIKAAIKAGYSLDEIKAVKKTGFTERHNITLDAYMKEMSDEISKEKNKDIGGAIV